MSMNPGFYQTQLAFYMPFNEESVSKKTGKCITLTLNRPVIALTPTFGVVSKDSGKHLN